MLFDMDKAQLCINLKFEFTFQQTPSSCPPPTLKSRG